MGVGEPGQEQEWRKIETFRLGRVALERVFWVYKKGVRLEPRIGVMGLLGDVMVAGRRRRTTHNCLDDSRLLGFWIWHLIPFLAHFGMVIAGIALTEGTGLLLHEWSDRDWFLGLSVSHIARTSSLNRALWLSLLCICTYGGPHLCISLGFVLTWLFALCVRCLSFI